MLDKFDAIFVFAGMRHVQLLDCGRRDCSKVKEASSACANHRQKSNQLVMNTQTTIINHKVRENLKTSNFHPQSS